MTTRLAIVASHPVQYYAPWFRLLAATPRLDLQAFYLWDFGVDRGGGGKVDEKFGVGVTWDVPLLSGYIHEFVPNAAADAGTHRFGGLHNPDLGARLAAFDPDAVLVFGYAYRSLVRLLTVDRVRHPALRRAKWLFRGDSHDLGGRPGGMKKALKRRLAAAAFARFDRFLAVGEANAEYFVARGVSADRVHHAPHCVDNARFAAASTPAAGAELRANLDISSDAAVVLFAGKFEPKKDPLGVVRAFLVADVPRSMLMMVGSGELEADLQAAAGNDARVRFLGFRNQTEMPAAYAAADLLALPSVGRSETWGLAVNEAFACGTPAIVSDRVGCGPDLVSGRESGLVVPAGDADALADAFRSVLTDRPRLAEWGENARRVITEYSYEAARDGLLETLVAEGLRPAGAETLIAVAD